MLMKPKPRQTESKLQPLSYTPPGPRPPAKYPHLRIVPCRHTHTRAQLCRAARSNAYLRAPPRSNRIRFLILRPPVSTAPQQGAHPAPSLLAPRPHRRFACPPPPPRPARLRLVRPPPPPTSRPARHSAPTTPRGRPLRAREWAVACWRSALRAGAEPGRPCTFLHCKQN